MTWKPPKQKFSFESPCVWGLYAITDRNLSQLSHIECARALLHGGAKVIQLRDKTMPFEQLLEVGRNLRSLTHEYSAALLVNDNPYLARDINADGVHLGWEDCPTEIARDILGPEKIIGLSTHSSEQILQAIKQPVNYIGIGPVYQTQTKASTYQPVGIDLIAWAARNISIPMVAIGGITEDNLLAVLQAGADNVAIIRDLLHRTDISDATDRIRNVIESHLRVR